MQLPVYSIGLPGTTNRLYHHRRHQLRLCHNFRTTVTTPTPTPTSISTAQNAADDDDDDDEHQPKGRRVLPVSRSMVLPRPGVDSRRPVQPHTEGEQGTNLRCGKGPCGCSWGCRRQQQRRRRRRRRRVQPGSCFFVLSRAERCWRTRGEVSW